MSAFVLNRNYELQLPNSFVDVDREEMEYLEGGWYFSRRFYSETGMNSLKIAACCFSAAAIISAFGAIITSWTGIGLAAFVLLGGYSGYVAWKCWEGYNAAAYYYDEKSTYKLTVSGIGPVVTGVRVDQ